MLERFADTLEEHQEGMLAYYNGPISTGSWKEPTPRSGP
jgi:transposase